MAQHYFTKAEGLHIAVHRDEWGEFTSRRHGYCFAYGIIWANNSINDNYFHNNSKDDFIKNHTRMYKPVTVIDRKHKRCLIADFEQKWMLERSLPDDYEIFRCYDTYIKDYKDGYNLNRLIRQHLKYLVLTWVNANAQAYKCVLGKTNVYHGTPHWGKDINLRNFITKYNVLYKTLLDKPLVDTVKIRIGKDWYDTTNVNCPTIWQILHDTVFTDEEYKRLEQCQLYTKSCYGRGVSFDTVKKYWDKPAPVTDEMIKDVVKIPTSKDFTQCDSFGTLVEEYSKLLKFVDENTDKENIKITEANKEYALRQLPLLTVNDWREGKQNTGYQYITYSSWGYHNRHCKNKSWKDVKEWVSTTIFKNTQLRLQDDKVITSKGATVNLNEAIIFFNRIVAKTIKDNPLPAKSHKFESKTRINLGYYNFRYIQRTDKVFDNGKDAGFVDWVIVIGCHHLWLREIADFINYYKLNDKCDEVLWKSLM